MLSVRSPNKIPLPPFSPLGSRSFVLPGASLRGLALLAGSGAVLRGSPFAGGPALRLGLVGWARSLGLGGGACAVRPCWPGVAAAPPGGLRGSALSAGFVAASLPFPRGPLSGVGLFASSPPFGLSRFGLGLVVAGSFGLPLVVMVEVALFRTGRPALSPAKCRRLGGRLSGACDRSMLYEQ